MIKIPKWITSALAALGEQEIPGPAANSFIASCLSTVKQAGNDEISWCSAFVNKMMMDAGIIGTNSAAARSWMSWGQALDAMRFGCVAVYKRGTDPTSGHVNFAFGVWGDQIIGLGGNQSDRVKFSLYPKLDLLGYRWPTALI